MVCEMGMQQKEMWPTEISTAIVVQKQKTRKEVFKISDKSDHELMVSLTKNKAKQVK